MKKPLLWIECLLVRHKIPFGHECMAVYWTSDDKIHSIKMCPFYRFHEKGWDGENGCDSKIAYCTLLNKPTDQYKYAESGIHFKCCKIKIRGIDKYKFYRKIKVYLKRLKVKVDKHIENRRRIRFVKKQIAKIRR